MHKGQVRKIEQVVDYQSIITFYVKVFSSGEPILIVKEAPGGNPRRIGQRRITHPNPYEAPSFDYWVAMNICTCRNLGLAGDLDTSSGTVESHPVVTAFEGIFDQTPFGEREAAMRTAVFERDNGAFRGSEQDHRLV